MRHDADGMGPPRPSCPPPVTVTCTSAWPESTKRDEMGSRGEGIEGRGCWIWNEVIQCLSI